MGVLIFNDRSSHKISVDLSYFPLSCCFRSKGHFIACPMEPLRQAVGKAPETTRPRVDQATDCREALETAIPLSIAMDTYLLIHEACPVLGGPPSLSTRL